MYVNCELFNSSMQMICKQVYERINKENYYILLFIQSIIHFLEQKLTAFEILLYFVIYVSFSSATEALHHFLTRRFISPSPESPVKWWQLDQLCASGDRKFSIGPLHEQRETTGRYRFTHLNRSLHVLGTGYRLWRFLRALPWMHLPR